MPFSDVYGQVTMTLVDCWALLKPGANAWMYRKTMMRPLTEFLDWAVAQVWASALVPSISDTNTRSEVAMGFMARPSFAQEDPHENDQHRQQMQRQACLVRGLNRTVVCCIFGLGVAVHVLISGSASSLRLSRVRVSTKVGQSSSARFGRPVGLFLFGSDGISKFILHVVVLWVAGVPVPLRYFFF